MFEWDQPRLHRRVTIAGDVGININGRRSSVRRRETVRRADRNRDIVARAGNSARTSAGAGGWQCVGSAVRPLFYVIPAQRTY